MALIVTVRPIAAIHGKLSKKDNIYFSVRYGKQVAVRMQPWQDHPTEIQSQHRQRMRECNEVVRGLMSIPAHRERYEQMWKAALADGASHHTRLRDYIYSLTYQTLYQSQI